MYSVIMVELNEQARLNPLKKVAVFHSSTKVKLRTDISAGDGALQNKLSL